MVKSVTACVAAGMLLAGGCGQESPEPSASTSGGDAGTGSYTIATTFYPTTYFAHRLTDGVPGVEVVCPVPAEADPIFWQPGGEDIGLYQASDLIVLNGAGFEKWARSAALPRSRTVDTAEQFSSQFIMLEGKTHSHGVAGEHTHEGLVAHTWLDPVMAIGQARAMGEAIAEGLPEDGEDVLGNFESLVSDLFELDERFQALYDRIAGAQLLASHPAYNYLAQRYGWDLHSFDFDPGEALSAAQQGEVQEQSAANPGSNSIMLWESEPLPETAELLRSRFGIVSVWFSPCETRPDEGDYLSVMHANIDRLEAALEP